MKKLVVRGKYISCCIDCDYISTNADNNIVTAYQDEFIVGIFNLDDVSALYLSEKKD